MLTRIMCPRSHSERIEFRGGEWTNNAGGEEARHTSDLKHGDDDRLGIGISFDEFDEEDDDDVESLEFCEKHPEVALSIRSIYYVYLIY